MFLALVLLGALASFTTKSQATGGLKVKVELSSGVVADLESIPLELFKTMEDVENSKSVKVIFTNTKGEGTFSGIEAGSYFLDGMVETDAGQVYYKVMKVDIIAGQTGAVVLKLERDLEFEGDLDDEDDDE